MINIFRGFVIITTIIYWTIIYENTVSGIFKGNIIYLYLLIFFVPLTGFLIVDIIVNLKNKLK